MFILILMINRKTRINLIKMNKKYNIYKKYRKTFKKTKMLYLGKGVLEIDQNLKVKKSKPNNKYNKNNKKNKKNKVVKTIHK